MTRVAVVGAGISGLSAALAALDEQPAAELHVFEADGRVGGKIRTTPFAGLPAVDEGADAFLRRVPEGTALAARVGIDELTAPAAAAAAVWWNGMHPIPTGLLLGMPTDVMALARSPLLSVRGRVRAALEPLVPRSPTAPDSLGAWVRDRFGDEVQERLVDPLVGSIYAADTDIVSLRAVPQIAQLAMHSRSVLLAARSRPVPAGGGPVFAAPTEGGMAALTDATAAAVTAAGGIIHTGRSVTEVVAGNTWLVDGEPFDGVVLAVPAAAAARLLAAVDAEVARTLAAIPTADVIMLSLVVPGGPWTRTIAARSGFLVPKPQQRLVTAVSYGSQKWAHWQPADASGSPTGEQLLRVSLGRDGLPVMQLDDEAALSAAIAELAQFHGVVHQPSQVRITRWPAAFAQYRPHHDAVIADAERRLPTGLYLAGAGFHGIGIPACIRSGQRAGRRAAGDASSARS
jgi:oxygen-dependent protoporphyrinogen oxidase